MNPVTHFLSGWLIANIDHLERRDRALVALSAVIPDIDGLGIPSAVASQEGGRGLDEPPRFKGPPKGTPCASP